MHFRFTAAALAALAWGTAHAEEDPMFKFSGYGTLSAVHSSERQADFIGSANQPNGAGFTRSTSLDPDSKLGVQVHAKLTDKWSAVLQVVAQHQYDNSYTPQLEWANVKYQLSHELSVRLGRIASPTFMVSDSRLVGYANPFVRPPTEVYSVNPITSTDGVDATHRSTIGGMNNTFQAYYGRASIKLPSRTTATAQPSWGFSESVENGALTLRLGFLKGRTTLEIPRINPLFDGLNQFAAGVGAVPVPAYQAAAAQASALALKYKPEGMASKVYAVGVNYDPGDWFVSAEYAAARPPEGLLTNGDCWYVGAGYRFGSLTPYMTYASSKTKAQSEPGISTAGLDPQTAGGAAALNGGLNALISGFYKVQTSVAFGTRWDLMANLALKAQYERQRLGANSAGLLSNVQPGFVSGGKVNIVTVAVDFVF